jgi:O-antigen/teichoic acid export membrane protein
MAEDSLKKRYTIKLLANIVSGIIGAITVAIVPKALGPVAYGQFTYLQQFFAKALGFLDMGSSIAFFTKLSARSDRKELIAFYLLFSLLILLLICGFVYFSDAFGIINGIIPGISINNVYLGLFFGFLTWFTQVYIKISDAYALTVSVELIKAVHKVLSLLLLVLFIYQLSFDLKLFFYYNYIAIFSFLIIITIVFVKKRVFARVISARFSFKNLSKEFYSYCSPLFVYSVIGLLAGIFDIWLLQTISGSEQMGYYGLAYSLAAMCFLFTSAMTPIITREFSKSYEQKNIEAMRKLFYRYIPMLYSVAAYFSVFISVQSENVLMIFTDEQFEDVYFVLVIMALYPIHQTYGQLSGSIFYATGQTKLMRNMALFTMPLGMLIALIFIYLLELEAIGLASKMIIGQLIGVNIQLYFNAKFLSLDIKHFVWHQIYAVMFFMLFAIISGMLVSMDSALIDFIASGLIYTLFVAIFSYVFPQVFSINRNELELILKKAFKRFERRL